MTKDTVDFKQFRTVACREYTLPRDDPASLPKGWIQGNMRIGPVIEVTTSFQYGKHGIEIRIWSVGLDNSQSYFRISYGTNKYVIDSNHNITEIPADPHEDQTSQNKCQGCCSQIKGKTNHKRVNLLIHQLSYRCTKENGLTLSHQHQPVAAYDVSKKVISLLRHNQTVQREDDGAIQYWTIKFHLRNHSSQVQHWSDERWKSCLTAGGGSKRRYQYCSDNSGTILHLRALQGHSGHNLIDPTLQDNVLIQCGIFHHIYRIGCAFIFHSIINNGLIPGGQDFKQKTNSILLAH